MNDRRKSHGSPRIRRPDLNVRVGNKADIRELESVAEENELLLAFRDAPGDLVEPLFVQAARGDELPIVTLFVHTVDGKFLHAIRLRTQDLARILDEEEA